MPKGATAISGGSVATGGPKGGGAKFAGGGGVEGGRFGGSPSVAGLRATKEGTGPTPTYQRINSLGDSIGRNSPKAEFGKPGVTAVRKPGAFASTSEFAGPAGKEPTQAAQKTSLQTKFVSTIEAAPSQGSKFQPATGENLQQLQQQASEAALRTLGGNTLRAGQETTGTVKIDGKNNTIEIVSIDKPKSNQTHTTIEPTHEPVNKAGEVSGDSHQPTTVEQIRSFKEQTTEQALQRITEISAQSQQQTADRASAQSFSKDVRIVEVSGAAQANNQSAAEVSRPANLAEPATDNTAPVANAPKSEQRITTEPANVLTEPKKNSLQEPQSKKDTDNVAQQQARPVEKPKTTDTTNNEKVADAKTDVAVNTPIVADPHPVTPGELAPQVGDRVSEVKAEDRGRNDGSVKKPETSELTNPSVQRKDEILHELSQIADQQVAEGRVQAQVVSSRIEEIHANVPEIPTADLRAVAADEIQTTKDSQPKTSGEKFGIHLRKLVDTRIEEQRQKTGKENATHTNEPTRLTKASEESIVIDAKSITKGSWKEKAKSHLNQYVGFIDWEELLKKKKKDNKSAYERIVQREATKTKTSDQAILSAQKVNSNGVQPFGAASVSSQNETTDNKAEQAPSSDLSVQTDAQNVSAAQQEQVVNQLLPQSQTVVTPEQAQQLQAQGAEQAANQLGGMAGTVIFNSKENPRQELKLDKNAKKARQEAIIDGVAKAPRTPEGTVTGPDVVAAADKKDSDAVLSAVVILAGEKQDGGNTIVFNNIAQIGELPPNEMLGQALAQEEGIRPVAIAEKGGGADERDLFVALSKVKKTELSLAA